MKSAAGTRIIASPFFVGAVVILVWFLWQHRVIEKPYSLIEWLVFYLIAILSWEPAAKWLREGAHWVPAAEVFFLLHIIFYVNPFLSGREEIQAFEEGIRIKVGLVITLFLVACRSCYRIPQVTSVVPRSKQSMILDRELQIGRMKDFIWIGLVAWALFNLGLQQSLFPDLGSYFNTVRTLISTIANLSMFILFYDLGCGRLSKTSRYFLLTLTTLSMLVQITSGFLIGSAIQTATALMAFSIGKKKIPVLTFCVILAFFAFLHAGKADMRAEFWEEGKNYTLTAHNPLNIYQFWIKASWNHITTTADDDQDAESIIERGSLLQYLSLVVSETPESRPYMGGVTYLQSIAIFIPRFLWPNKPRSTTSDETLSIYYGLQTEESVESTSISLGRISEAWANSGWIGVFLVAGLTGLILRIPSNLSCGYAPQHFRFLLAVPFFLFAINHEMCLGPAIHTMSQSVLASAAVLWIMSKPAVSHNADLGAKETPRHSNLSPQLELQTLQNNSPQ